MRARLRPAERREVVLALVRRLDHVDVLDSEFVDAYAEATGASTEPRALGADWCPMLARDLLAMHHDGVLDRRRVGLTGMEEGFPRWVWVYELAEAA